MHILITELRVEGNVSLYLSSHSHGVLQFLMVHLSIFRIFDKGFNDDNGRARSEV